MSEPGGRPAVVFLRASLDIVVVFSPSFLSKFTNSAALALRLPSFGARSFSLSTVISITQPIHERRQATQFAGLPSID